MLFYKYYYPLFLYGPLWTNLCDNVFPELVWNRVTGDFAFLTNYKSQYSVIHRAYLVSLWHIWLTFYECDGMWYHSISHFHKQLHNLHHCHNHLVLHCSNYSIQWVSCHLYRQNFLPQSCHKFPTNNLQYLTKKFHEILDFKINVWRKKSKWFLGTHKVNAALATYIFFLWSFWFKKIFLW